MIEWNHELKSDSIECMDLNATLNSTRRCTKLGKWVGDTVAWLIHPFQSIYRQSSLPATEKGLVPLMRRYFLWYISPNTLQPLAYISWKGCAWADWFVYWFIIYFKEKLMLLLGYCLVGHKKVIYCVKLGKI